jgi:acyl carrier protein
VLARLRDATGIDGLKDEQELARDLGLDSLAITDILLWLEREFAVSVPGVEAVRTVGDMVMAACGAASAESADVQIPRHRLRGCKIRATRACKFQMANSHPAGISRAGAPLSRDGSSWRICSKEAAPTAI